MKLYTINTVNNFMDIIYTPFTKPFADANPDIKVYNIMDDSLLKDTTAAKGMTPEIASRILHYAKAAEHSGADGIIVTCTSVNEATSLVKPLLSIPIINIEEPTAEAAVMSSGKIGILATLPTSPVAIGRTIDSYAAKHGKIVDKVIRVAEGAFDVLCSGDRAKHDEMVNEELYKLSKEVDTIVFAQISMSLLRHEAVGVPIFKIGQSGFDRIKQLMQANRQ